jgi:hypothetical protein
MKATTLLTLASAIATCIAAALPNTAVPVPYARVPDRPVIAVAPTSEAIVQDIWARTANEGTQQVQEQATDGPQPIQPVV